MPVLPQLSASLSLHSGEQAWGTERRMALLAAIGTEGSISAAARKVGLSYKAAWDAVDLMNNVSGEVLVERLTGGRGGGGARLTGRGRELVAWFEAVRLEQGRFMQALARLGPDSVRHLDLLHSMTLQTSARNRFDGVVTALDAVGVNDRVSLDVAGAMPLFATLTHASTERLGLVVGRRAFALIKAQAVHIVMAPLPVAARQQGADAGAAPLARNVWAGRVVRCEQAGALAEIELEVAPGIHITGLATLESGSGAMPVGSQAVACFEAADVLIGTMD